MTIPTDTFLLAAVAVVVVVAVGMIAFALWEVTRDWRTREDKAWRWPRRSGGKENPHDHD